MFSTRHTGFTVREWTVLADRFGQPCCLNFKKIAFPFSSDCQRNCRRYWEGIVGVFQSDTDGEFKTTPTVTAHLKKKIEKKHEKCKQFSELEVYYTE